MRGKSEHVLLTILVVFYFALSLWRIQGIDFPYFDEIFYVEPGKAIVQFAPSFWSVHPPLAMIIIGLGIVVIGDNPLGWRGNVLLLSTAMIPFTFLLGRKMFGSKLGAIIPAFLLTFDFMHFTLGRLAILDTSLVFFTILMQYSFFSYYRYAKENSLAHSNKWMIAASVSFGLAFASKWPALFSFLGLVAIFLYLTWRRHLLTRGKDGTWRRTLGPIAAGLLCLALAGLVYMLSYLPYFVAGDTLGTFAYRQLVMVDYHASAVLSLPFDSRWWSWPLMLIPIAMQFGSLSTRVTEVVLMGNPAIWWATYPVLIGSIYRVARRHEEILAYLLVMFFASWLPFALLTRDQMIFYFYQSLPTLQLMIAYWLLQLWTTRKGKILVAGYLSGVVLLFLIYYPILSALPIPVDQARDLQWLPRWKPIIFYPTS